MPGVINNFSLLILSAKKGIPAIAYLRMRYPLTSQRRKMPSKLYSCLVGVQLKIPAFLFNQFIVFSMFNNFSVLNY
jgi:hypothetical protein